MHGRRRIVAGHIIIASTPQIWQTWRKHRPECLSESWRAWSLSGVYGIQPPSPIEYHRLERRRIEEVAALVAEQWKVSIAASVVMVGGALYQEVAIRARMNVVKRIDGRSMRRQLARWAGEHSA